MLCGAIFDGAIMCSEFGLKQKNYAEYTWEQFSYLYFANTFAEILCRRYRTGPPLMFRPFRRTRRCTSKVRRHHVVREGDEHGSNMAAAPSRKWFSGSDDFFAIHVEGDEQWDCLWRRCVPDVGRSSISYDQHGNKSLKSFSLPFRCHTCCTTPITSGSPFVGSGYSLQTTRWTPLSSGLRPLGWRMGWLISYRILGISCNNRTVFIHAQYMWWVRGPVTDWLVRRAVEHERGNSQWVSFVHSVGKGDR